MTTLHSMERIHQRLGLSGSRAEAFLEAGIAKGRTAESFRRKDERRYLEGKSGDNIIAKVYQGYCLIIDTEWEACITVYKLPEWFGKKQYYYEKEKLRNPAKYIRNYAALTM